jgi:hypothetical protein
MAEFPNPYAEEREKSPGELTQEYAELFKMASLLLGLEFTDREKAAIPVVIGAVLRESKKRGIVNILQTIQDWLPK